MRKPSWLFVNLMAFLLGLLIGALILALFFLP
jgi:hypothetical protein